MMMWLKYLSGPLVGAVIGYFTNYIAVKMLFHPYEEKHLGSWKLPFTPGMIPKEKDRLGHAIAEAVTTSLLTEEMLTSALLSEESIEQVTSQADRLLDQCNKNETSLKHALLARIGEEKYDYLTDQIVEKLSKETADYLVKANLGAIVREQAMQLVAEKLGGGLFAMFGGGGLVDSIGEEIEKKVNQYIEEHGDDMVYQFLLTEQSKIEALTISEASGYLDEYRTELKQAVGELYTKIVRSHMPKMLEKIHMKDMIEQKIAEMKIEELEELCLSVMKKELDGIVNLGAVIGAVIGVLNMLINLFT